MLKKKGSLELSINAIVIIVLAFVLLGLGLGFVRSQFKSMTTTTSQVQEQVKQQILEDLRTGDKKLSFPSQRVNIDKGSTMDLAVGIKNTLPQGNLDFYIDIYTAQKQGATPAETIKCTKTVASEDDVETGTIECSDGGELTDISYFLEKGPFNLGAADAEVYPISLGVGRSQGTYLVKISIYQANADGTLLADTPPYAEKTFFVQVG